MPRFSGLISRTLAAFTPTQPLESGTLPIDGGTQPLEDATQPLPGGTQPVPGGGTQPIVGGSTAARLDPNDNEEGTPPIPSNSPDARRLHIRTLA